MSDFATIKPVLLVTLLEAYQESRRRLDVAHPPVDTADINRPGICRYCGKTWFRWAGGKFDGHVRCAVDIGFQRQMADVLRSSPHIGIQDIATTLGVTVSVVSAWWNNATGQKRR